MTSRAMSVNLGLPVTPLFVKDQDTYQELYRLYNAVRNIVYNYDAVTGAMPPDITEWNTAGITRVTISNTCKIYKQASVDIAYGQTVKLIDAGGGVAQAALGTDGAVIGFCSATTGSLAGEWTEITCIGVMPPFAPGTLTPGAKYYQSGTPGSVGAGGTGLQCVGFALDDTHLFVRPELS
jgi:hypothetical protein